MRRYLIIASSAVVLSVLAASWSFFWTVQSHPKELNTDSIFPLSAKQGTSVTQRNAGGKDGAADASQAFFDPLEIGPCNLTPHSEQDVSSQVDGIFDDVLVDVGHQVRKGDVLGRLDDRQLRAQVELLAIRAASEAVERIAKAQYDEADAKVQYVQKANETGLRTVPELEAKTYLCQRERYASEVKKAREEREEARKELEKTTVVLQQHEIRAGLAGEIVKVYKRSGETVKQGEPVFRIANCNSLRVEGLCKIQQANLIHVGMRALVEPEIRGEQLTQLIGHTGTITSLAISSDGQLLASAGEDRNLFLWNWPQGTRYAQLPHPAEITAVALLKDCGPPPMNWPGPSSKYLLVSGCSDGRVLLWSDYDKPVSRTLSQQHEGPIRAVAFSADGWRFATAGDDKRIGIWQANTGKFLFWLHAEDGLTAHQGAVTSLRFCPDGQLISAGRDHLVKVWRVGENAGSLVQVNAGRTCEVAHLGVSSDGRRFLFDLGDELRILERDGGNCLGSLHSRRQGRFQGVAEFSPSGRLVLTASSNQRLQLWRVPAVPEETQFFRQGYTRGFDHGSLLALRGDPAGMLSQAFASSQGMTPKLWDLPGREVCHFVIPNASTVNAGVFAPDESAFFTGGTDKVVRVWAAPAPAQWQQSYEARITYVGNQIERGTDMVRIRAELENPADPRRRLRAGMFATLRVYPETAALK
jgi:WD40 repeat protein